VQETQDEVYGCNEVKDMSKNEIIFYASVGIATLINVIGAEYGFAVFTLLPSMLIVVFIGLKVFPPEKRDK
jgi:hypothetical protein